ncbi:MAG: hypothetical protein WCO55_06235 [Candidatus Falkowbacteria bacterium]
MPKKKAAEVTAPKRVFRRRLVEPTIDEEEIIRLKQLLAQEENLEEDLRRDMEDIIHDRDRALAKQLRYLEDRNKRLMMWIGTIFFMLIIVLFWLAGIRAMASPSFSKKSEPEQIDIGQTKDDLTRVMNRVITGIDDLKKQANQLNTVTGTPTSSEPFPVAPATR